MASSTIEISKIGGTDAGQARAGVHSVIVDRPEGRAGGLGLGMNGAQLTAIAIGGCLFNDLHYVAAGMGATLGEVSIKVTVEMAGDPLLITSASIAATCRRTDDSDADDVLAAAWKSSTAGNSIMRGFPITCQPASQ